jgi:hypothetical protein
VSLVLDRAPAQDPAGLRVGNVDRPPTGLPFLSRIAWPVAAMLSAMLATVARWGYNFGVGEHVVLSLKGIAHADPTAYANDWFTWSVSQPHWLFDAVTYAGERFGVLPLAYLAWWLASFAAFGCAAVWLTRRFLPGQPWMAVLVGPTLALGQSTAMGSSSALYGSALPHGLGACLGFLSLAGLLTGRWRAAAVAAFLAAMAHVQHGADLAPVLLLTAVLATRRPRAHRIALAGVGGALLAQAAAVARLRGIENGGAGWLEACRQAIPFHCDANTWTVSALAGGGLAIAVALAFAVRNARRDWRTSAPAVAFPAAALLGAVLADRFDLPVAGRLAQQFNIYRYAGFVLPTAAFVLVWMTGRLRDSWSPGRAVGLAGLWLAWLTVSDATFHYARPASFAAALLLAAVFVVTAPEGRGRVPLSLVATALLLTATVTISGFAPVHLGYDRADARVAAALAIGRVVPPGSVIAADPRISWLRRASRRAVIAECKGIAFGGTAWAENTRRIGDLGGWPACMGAQGGGFRALTPAGVEALVARYGATHVLLTGDDPKLAHARGNWTLVLELPPRPSALMEQGWSLFELPVS